MYLIRLFRDAILLYGAILMRDSVLLTRIRVRGDVGIAITSHLMTVLFPMASLLLPRRVGLVVEVPEEVVEEDGVRESEAHGPPRVTAVVEKQLHGVEECYTKLHLKKSQDDERESLGINKRVVPVEVW